jgi:phage terminase small subunit
MDAVNQIEQLSARGQAIYSLLRGALLAIGSPTVLDLARYCDMAADLETALAGMDMAALIVPTAKSEKPCEWLTTLGKIIRQQLIPAAHELGTAAVVRKRANLEPEMQDAGDLFAEDGEAEAERGLDGLPVEPPAALFAEAAAIWRAARPWLEALGCTLLDTWTVMAYCAVEAVKRRALGELDGLELVARRGAIRQRSPWFTVLKKQIELEKSLGHVLGTTPAVRRRARMEEDGGGDEFDQLEMFATIAQRADVSAIPLLRDEPSEYLSAAARASWRAVWPLMEEIGCRECDRNALDSYCCVSAIRERAVEQTSHPEREGGGLMTRNGGESLASIWFGIKADADGLLHKLAADLLVSPVARKRSGVESDGASEDDGFMALLRAGRAA